MNVQDAVSRVNWEAVLGDLDEFGVAPVGQLLDSQTCLELRNLYDQDAHFRSRIVMQRHGFGSGEYKYFANPLPQVIAGLRHGFYERLAPFANGWNERMGLDRCYPPELDSFLAECHGDGQTKPTPLLLKYGAGDYNCLHQDVYGAHLFPVQLVILLSEPKTEFEGGEFVMTEQRPRMQSRAEVVSLGIGHGALFAVNDRPKAGSRGDYRVKMRHGVSRIRSGERFTLGIIFHDAK
ncbi:hypothetical protein CO731_03862 [Aminobacter sp. MSH1]|uniref:2OG-Fe(II) oxygenase n=1 Tax=Aminobacter sp. MSH1 TaxID=374606 RepID=UPI000D39A527|nr:2OG-Fe(II) oxygenase [Aminobacter sp. MSH1]AWC24377.1 hypothetical protein CO731_03862 [Aminobacter sp. MSH1]